MTTLEQIPAPVQGVMSQLSLIEAFGIIQLPGYYGNVGAVAADFGIDHDYLVNACERMTAVIKDCVADSDQPKADAAHLSKIVIAWLTEHTNRIDRMWEDALEPLDE